jgi:hypothetical protein
VQCEVLEALAVSEALSVGTDLHRQQILVAPGCANVVKEINAGDGKC